MFSFEPGSTQENAFKHSKRGAHIKNLPKFSITSVSDLDTSISVSPLVLTSMSQAFEIVLNQTPAGVVQSINKNLIQFV